MHPGPAPKSQKVAKSQRKSNELAKSPPHLNGTAPELKATPPNSTGTTDPPPSPRLSDSATPRLGDSATPRHSALGTRNSELPHADPQPTVREVRPGHLG